ncbi:hypothetical protein OIDMADRAFT_19260 [Oidiodendron maius Zn]|uniref:Uncharacterized protein n=1 Tax=Oidiodendron maius (strain Zn) TaxID=913774 RepID=A0A0C3GZL6_OIDMZ|nr:hypothetical protein OIDMADRAFT_19260 [Oidiodendron maius Zn]
MPPQCQYAPYCWHSQSAEAILAVNGCKYIFLGGNCFRPIHFDRYFDAPFWKGVKVTNMDSYHEDEERAKDFICREAELKRREGDDALVCISHTDALEEFGEF